MNPRFVKIFRRDFKSLIEALEYPRVSILVIYPCSLVRAIM